MPGSRRALVCGSALVAAVASALGPAVASAGLFSPDSPASSSATEITTTIVVAVVVVTLAALGAIVAFVGAVRAGGTEERRTRGTGSIQTKVAGGLGAAALALFILGVVATEAVRSTDEADASGATPLEIETSAQQWIYRYQYPIPEGVDIAPKPGVFSYYELVVPVETPITLRVNSIDVLHNWAVPALAQQIDINPGEVDGEVSFVADAEGVYEGRSHKFSGPGYASMRTRVRVVGQEEYTDWVEQQAAEIQEANAAVQERIDEGEIPGISGGLK
ncbi:MAG: hypothetical protein ACR2K6_05935 [Solirubrobacterales bacterium]